MAMAAEAAAAAAAKAQAFAHRLVEFADAPTCRKFLEERGVDLDRPNGDGWSVLMSACACGRDDLVGFVLDRTTNVRCATATNRTTALHLAAISANELLATPERQEKLRPIANMPNLNGDTPLMMACVAKNDVAARLLAEQLGADPAYGNATGMNALMCAARLSVDAKMDAAIQEELTRRSLAIVELLLKRNVPLDITEMAAGNSALHFAVMSSNHAVVKRFLTAGRPIDVLCKNKAGRTAIDLAKRADAHQDIISLLQTSADALEAELSRQRALVEEELVAAGMDETKSSKTNGPKSKSKNPRKSKRQGTAHKNVEKNGAEVSVTEAQSDPRGDEAAGKATAEIEPAQAELRTLGSSAIDASDEDSSEWHSVSAKKTRSTATARPSKMPTKPTNTKAATTRSTATIANRPVEGAKHSALRRSSDSSSNAPARHTAAATVQKIEETQQRLNKQMSWQSEVLHPPVVESNARSAGRSYERLDEAFHRGFPIAAELELGVETFLIGSSAADRELQPDDGLSISQVEVLQEAHWQAYHYLNEKKLDLARVLEAQRVEAQFALQQEILHLE